MVGSISDFLLRYASSKPMILEPLVTGTVKPQIKFHLCEVPKIESTVISLTESNGALRLKGVLKAEFT